MPDGSEIQIGNLYPSLKSTNLSFLCGSGRFQRLDTAESYYRCTQYESRRYTWDGRMRGYGMAADIEPGWYVPMRHRKPSARLDLARLIVRRFTSMVFGSERFPQLVVDGDDDAQDYVRALAKACRLSGKMQELRNKGGAQGSAGASFGFVDGRPRVAIHNAKHITILGWADRYEHRPRAVLESYAYPRTVWDAKTARPKEVTMYFARYWDESVEITWDPIPADVAKEPGWADKVQSATIEHGYGFCPFYWVQNLPDSDDVDGDSDFVGMPDTMDEINELLSATSKGMKANVDPTLVIKADRTQNTGLIRKGSENAIYSPGGADYLELRGDSLRAALELLRELRKEVLDTTGIVLGDPSEIGGKAQSAAALRILYMPMITQADILREQYGAFIVQLMNGMLRAAKQIQGQEPGEAFVTADGQRMQHKPTVLLPQRVETVEKSDEPGEAKEHERIMVDRVPGNIEEITLNWPPYFPNTWADTKSAVEATQAARGSAGAIISRKTATESVAAMFGIADVDDELESIDADRATDMAFMQQAMGDSGAPEADPGAGSKGPGDGAEGD